MQLSSFDEVLRLDQDALRQILGNGPTAQRVWAAWALGLRLGQAFAAEAGTRVDREPDPGVRRHLAVILASAGDRAAIDVLAADDPCEYVRASALRLILQIAPPGTQSSVVSRLLEVARAEPSAHVRSEALRLLSPADHHLPLERVAACLADPAVSVRAAAADLLLELPFDDRVAELLASAATTEPDTDELERLWQRVARLERAELVLGAVASGARGRHQLLAGLDILIHAQRKLPWRSLVHLADPDNAAVDCRLFHLLADPTTASVPFLLSRATAGLRLAQPRSREESDVRYVGHLALRALSNLGHRGSAAISAHPGATESVRWLVGQLADEVEGLRGNSTSDDDWLSYDDWVELEVEELEALRWRLLGLLGEGP